MNDANGKKNMGRERVEDRRDIQRATDRSMGENSGSPKQYWRVIPRYSAEWINSIPRSLARGIWDLIQDGIDERGEGGGPRRSQSAANERRVRQIAAGSLQRESRGVCEVVTDQDASAKHVD